jgi:hypothetical protein
MGMAMTESKHAPSLPQWMIGRSNRYFSSGERH